MKSDTNTLRVIVAGGREFHDYNLLEESLDRILSKFRRDYRTNDIQIVSGHARGADWLGEQYARENKYNLKLFPADWNTHGKKAGYLRNEEMADYSDILVAFWDGQSKGTGHMIDIMKKKGLPYAHVKI